VGRPGLRYLKQVARNTGADNYTAMERMACNSCRWKAAKQSKDGGIRRRRTEKFKKIKATHGQGIQLGITSL